MSCKLIFLWIWKLKRLLLESVNWILSVRLIWFLLSFLRLYVREVRIWLLFIIWEVLLLFNDFFGVVVLFGCVIVREIFGLLLFVKVWEWVFGGFIKIILLMSWNWLICWLKFCLVLMRYWMVGWLIKLCLRMGG